jgi:hypothetical protein
LSNDCKKQFKRYPGEDNGRFIAEYRGKGEEEIAFLCWLIDDVADILGPVNAGVNERIEADLQASAANRRDL